MIAKHFLLRFLPHKTPKDLLQWSTINVCVCICQMFELGQSTLQLFDNRHILRGLVQLAYSGIPLGAKIGLDRAQHYFHVQKL